MDTTSTRGRRGRQHREIIGSGITTGSKASKQTIFLEGGRNERAEGWTETGGEAVEDDCEGRSGLLLAVRRILIELLAAFLSLLSRARPRRFKCFWLCLRVRARNPLPPRPFSSTPLALYTLNRSRFPPTSLLPFPLPSPAPVPCAARAPTSLPRDFYGLDLLARRFVNHAKCTALKGATTT